MITKYYRPATLDEAIDLVSHPDAAIIGGGTTVSASRGDGSHIAVDLQDLELTGITINGPNLRIGAMTRLSDVVGSDLVPTVIRDLARREAPSTIRNAATVGGTVGAANPQSQLLTGLLAFRADVTIEGAGSTAEHTLDSVLEDPSLIDGIITAITIQTGGTAATARTGRTPADEPIVAVVAHRSADGAVTIAMSGVGDRQVIVDPASIGDLAPTPDFRGTTDYRSHLAVVLANRALAEIGTTP